MKNRIPASCPSCQKHLKVKTLHCESCGTTVDGLFSLPAFSVLSPESQEFIIEFVIRSGSLKEMGKHLKLSYPTVRNMLDEIINQLKPLQYENNND